MEAPKPVVRGLRSTRVVLPDGTAPATVLFADGRIEAIATGPTLLEGVLDVGDLVVSPGIVDCHVHVNEPGRTEWEGFETATRAAAAGGVTTLVDMPLNSIPVTTSADALAAKVASSENERFVDVGFWGGVVPRNANELPGLARAGVLGCKAFLVHSGIDEFPNATEADLRAAMPVLRDHGLPLLAHAELDLGAPPLHESPRAYAGYLASRPPEWEDAAIRLLVRLCRETGCAVHVVHLSSAGSLETLRRAKAEGLPISAETCPHYLCLEAEQVPDGATYFKCAPPIREHENRERLWQGLFDGVIDFVVTDHSPCTPHLKLPERGDFQEAWGGIASLQLGLPAVWTEAVRRGATVEQLAAWMSAGPARFAGQSGKKGRLAKGFDADVVVWDPDARFDVKAESLHYRHKISPYLGATLRGRVHRTFLRAQEVYDGVGHPAGPVGRALLHRNEVS
ncbi:MAG TPA: allantoinase AllB [Polyangiaceae bacterium]|jgi:allantoinase|nr:allantoinase AllB [Polyangiaceae bacterium]